MLEELYRFLDCLNRLDLEQIAAKIEQSGCWCSWCSTQEWCCTSCIVSCKESTPESPEKKHHLATVSFRQLFTSQSNSQVSGQLMAGCIQCVTPNNLFSSYPYKRLRAGRSHQVLEVLEPTCWYQLMYKKQVTHGTKKHCCREHCLVKQPKRLYFLCASLVHCQGWLGN